MPFIRLAPLVVLAACSVGDLSSSVDPPSTHMVPPDGATDTDATCATAPTGDWSGTSSIRLLSAGSSDQVHADAHWTLASTTGCVDHYLPSGTATYSFSGDCHATIDSPSTAIASGDGELVIDRTTAPATYALHGTTRWSALVTCDGDSPGAPLQIGGVWANATGSFDGVLISGGADGLDVTLAWSLSPASATFAPTAPACSEPATDQWHSTTSFADGASATLIWSRVSTDACVDTFALSGIASAPAAPCVYAPATQPAAPSDGTLTIDCSTVPPTFTLTGATVWTGTARCTMPDGSTEPYTGPVGGKWASFGAAFDGSSFSASTSAYDSGVLAWSLSRG